MFSNFLSRHLVGLILWNLNDYSAYLYLSCVLSRRANLHPLTCYNLQIPKQNLKENQTKNVQIFIIFFKLSNLKLIEKRQILTSFCRHKVVIAKAKVTFLLLGGTAKSDWEFRGNLKLGSLWWSLSTFEVQSNLIQTQHLELRLTYNI